MCYSIIENRLRFDMVFDEPVDDYKFPESLQSIEFSYNFNQNIDKVKFPDSLQSITFGYNFNQNIDKVKFPNSLQSIYFGKHFNQNIDKVLFFNSSDSITFRNYNNNLLNDKIKEIKIYHLNEPMTNLSLFLERIIFLKIDYGVNERDENIKKSKIPFGCKITYEL